MTHNTTSYLARLSAFIFGVIACCFFASPALATPQQAPQMFLFAKATCLDESGAPYSIAATTFNPVIYQMSLSDEDETKNIAPSDAQESQGCKTEMLRISVVASTEGSCSIAPGRIKHINAHTTDKGVFIPASIELELPAEPSNTCSSSAGPDKCEDHPPLPTLTVIKISQTSALHTTLKIRPDQWRRSSKLRTRQIAVKRPLNKRASIHHTYLDTPPPQG